MLKIFHTRGLTDGNDLSTQSQIVYGWRVENEFLTKVQWCMLKLH